MAGTAGFIAQVGAIRGTQFLSHVQAQPGAPRFGGEEGLEEVAPGRGIDARSRRDPVSASP